MTNQKKFEKLLKDYFVTGSGAEQYTLRKRAMDSKYIIFMNARNIKFCDVDFSEFIAISFGDSVDYTESNFTELCKESNQLTLTLEGDDFHYSISGWEDLLYVSAEFLLKLDYTPYTEVEVRSHKCSLMDTPVGYKNHNLSFHRRLFNPIRDGFGVFLDNGWKNPEIRDEFLNLYELKCLKDKENEYERSVYAVLKGDLVVCYIVNVPEMPDEPSLHIQDMALWKTMTEDLIQASDVGLLYQEDKIYDINEIL